jgi:hypothetical protein
MSTKEKEKFLVKVTSLAFEIILYTGVFLAFETQDMEVAVKAAIVLAVGIRFVLYVLKGLK